jgi:CBS domain containing-hemolysin-like protein
MLVAQAPWLIAMGILMLASAYFSLSEAALFSLSRNDRRALAAGNPAQRLAAGLLNDSDRLLTAVLFCNLLVNVAYFAISSIVSIHLKRDGEEAQAGIFALGSLLVLILVSEMVPKGIAVLKPPMVSTWVAVPLAALIRALDPVLAAFRVANLLSQRVLWPHFKPEPYLRIGDLERAVELSTDTALLEQEQKVLQSIVTLSGIRVDELMRPRTRFVSFRPPVALADLRGDLPTSGYLLVTESDSDEVAGAVALGDLLEIPDEHLERLAQPVAYVPWCTSVAEALEIMLRGERRVAAVVNELGETIGILTFEDILDTVFIHTSSRSERLLRRMPIRRVADDVWQVTGMTSLRRLCRHFQVERPPSWSVTVSGVLQEVLERLPAPGDECRWGPFHFKVLEVPERGQLLVELRRVAPDETEEAAP